MADLTTEISRIIKAKNDIITSLKSNGANISDGATIDTIATVIKNVNIMPYGLHAGEFRTTSVGGTFPLIGGYSITHGLVNIPSAIFIWRTNNSGVIDTEASGIFQGFVFHKLGMSNKVPLTTKTVYLNNGSSGVQVADYTYDIQVTNKEIVFPSSQGKPVFNGSYYWLAVS